MEEIGPPLLDEAARLRSLRALSLLDTPPSESFDRLTRLASRLYAAPIAAVSLTDADRQWFKSRIGCGTQIPRLKAPCAEVTRLNRPLVVPDLAADPRFIGGYLVEQGVRFYAGAPLTTRDGFTLGSMCVLDVEPRDAGVVETRALADLAAMVMAQIELQHSFGRVDPTSGLPNRFQLAEDITDLGQDHRGEERIAVLLDLADPVRLATSNRVLGPQSSDELLGRAAAALHEGVWSAKPYHVSGTQLMCIERHYDATSAVETIERIRQHLRGNVLTAGFAAPGGIAMGVVRFALGGIETRDLIRAGLNAADDARHKDEDIGEYCPDEDALHQRRFAIIGGLREALAEPHQFRLFYQPCIDLRAGTCTGIEALLRWTHPQLGELSPAEFIPLAEQTKLIKPLTTWVVAEALRQLAEWQAAGIFLRISVNVSAIDLQDVHFADGVGQALAAGRIAPPLLTIECTESALIGNRKRVLKNLSRLRDLGVSVALDDFGAGYSNFAYLKDIPADTLKIDQSFIRGLKPGSREARLAANLMRMGKDLGYTLVAEGIEDTSILSLLADYGCDIVQGYGIAAPLEARAFEIWFNARRQQATAA
jgi:EAL domain-containing protein (putative c-di-GMP-specific phosphodiesterase class I)/GGDEF domain-containing protein